MKSNGTAAAAASAAASADTSSISCKCVVLGDGSVGKTCMVYSYANELQFLAATQPYTRTVLENYAVTLPIVRDAQPTLSRRLQRRRQRNGPNGTAAGEENAHSERSTSPNAHDSSMLRFFRNKGERDGSNDRPVPQTVRLTLWDTAGQEQFDELRRMCYDVSSSISASAPSSSGKDTVRGKSISPPIGLVTSGHSRPTTPAGKPGMKRGAGRANGGGFSGKTDNVASASAVARARGVGEGGKWMAMDAEECELDRIPGSKVEYDVSVFLLCFAWDNPQSLTNVQMKWYREIKRVEQDWHRYPHGGERPFVVLLCGTKYDIRLEADRTGLTKGMVSREEAALMRQSIRADALVECSAKTGHGVRNVFHTAMLLWLQRQPVFQTKLLSDSSFSGLHTSLESDAMDNENNNSSMSQSIFSFVSGKKYGTSPLSRSRGDGAADEQMCNIL